MGWHYIPYKEGTWGTTKIFKQDGITFLGNDVSDYWFSNGFYAELGIQGQRFMWHSAKGNVLCCLGMGILPMLCALKPEVTSVTAIEIDKNVIDAFNEQGFNTDKIEIINSNEVIESFDFDEIESEIEEEPVKRGNVLTRWLSKWQTKDEDEDLETLVDDKPFAEIGRAHV